MRAAKRPRPDPATAGGSAESRALYERGERLLEERKWPEAKAVFEKLLEGDPGHYRAYPHYWRALVLEKEADALRSSVSAALDRFETIPRRKRSEEFYAAYLRGCSTLEDTNGGRTG